MARKKGDSGRLVTDNLAIKGSAEHEYVQFGNYARGVQNLELITQLLSVAGILPNPPKRYLQSVILFILEHHGCLTRRLRVLPARGTIITAIPLLDQALAARAVSRHMEENPARHTPEHPLEGVPQFARPQQAQENHDESDGDSSGPVQPLALFQVAHVASVHAEDTRHGAQGQEDDGHDGEGVHRVILARFRRVCHVTALEILC